MTDDNVIAIETRFTEAAPVELRQRRWDDCGHRHTSLHESLRTVSCRDCGEERLDPFEVLCMLAREWRAWQREAEQLRKLNAEYHSNERAKWERARDRHLNANPGHRGRLVAQTVERDPKDLWGASQSDFGCRTCYSLWCRFDRRWVPTRAPEPPPGKLQR